MKLIVWTAWEPPIHSRENHEKIKEVDQLLYAIPTVYYAYTHKLARFVCLRIVGWECGEKLSGPHPPHHKYWQGHGAVLGLSHREVAFLVVSMTQLSGY